MADVMKDKGNAALNAGKVDEAISHYTSAISLEPENHVLYSNRSAAYCKAGKYEEALEDAKHTIKLKPDWPKGYSRKGAALAYLKRYDAALESYKEGLKCDPNNVQLKEAVKEVEAQMSQPRGYTNPFADPGILAKLQNDERTREFLKDPDYLAMVNELQRNPASVMDKIRDPRLITTVSVLLGVDIAQQANEGASDLDSEEMDYSSKAESSDRKDKASSKEEPMETELSDEKKAALAEKELGNQEYKKKNFDVALQHYDKAIELDNTEMTFHTNKAAVYFERKEYEQCVKECEKAIEVGRENRADFKQLAKAYSRMAGAYYRLKDLYKARTYYQKSLTEHRTPDTLSRLSEVEKLIKEEERKAYIDPEKALEEKNKGKEAFQKGDYPTATKHYTEAIKRNPDDAILYSNRAACYQKLAEFQLALKDCETCIKLDPSFVRGYVRKGMALMALKEHSKATAAFQKALDLDPSNQDALDGYRKCMLANSSNPEEIRKRAMADPEIQKILSDPAMRLILEQMQSDSRAFHEHLKNPDIAAKIQKLLESGLIAIR